MQQQKFIIKSANGTEITISGYASVFNIPDSHNDIIAKGAFASNLEASQIKFLWQHDPLKPIGIIQSIQEDEHGLKIEAVINSKIETGREAIELVRQGALSGLSIGFNIKSSEYNALSQRVITEIELVEISIVTFPANEQAQIHHIANYEEEAQSITKNNKPSSEIRPYHKSIILEEKVNTMQNFSSVPENPLPYNNEHKAAFNNYLRKGEDMSELVTKGYSSERAEIGGAVVIPTLHEKILSEINALSIMRGLANIVTISTNALDLVIEEERLASGWVGESQERKDTETSKLKQKRILVHELYAQPKATQRLIDDAEIQIESWLAERIADSFARVENDAFINGNGDKKPIGILCPENKLPFLTCEDKITTEFLLDMINSLEEEYQQNSTFLMNRVTLSEIQKLKDKNDRFIWQPSMTDAFKPTIFGIPIVCCSTMPKPEGGNPAIALGDFKSAYTIVDRSGINIMRDPYTEKPFVKFYAVKRVGGDMVNPRAITLGKIGK